MFILTGQEKKYEVKKRRLLKGKSVPEYAAVEPRGRGLMVASERPFVFTHVDGSPLEQPDPEPMQVENSGGSAVPMSAEAAGILWITFKIRPDAHV